MAKKLLNNKNDSKGVKLPSLKDKPFKIAFEEKLSSGYEIKDMSKEHLKSLHTFISETIYRKLTISDVDKLFLRKEGLSNAPTIKYGAHELSHYGKDRNPFRLFGYYNDDGYFVVIRIDGEHKTHRS